MALLKELGLAPTQNGEPALEVEEQCQVLEQVSKRDPEHVYRLIKFAHVLGQPIIVVGQVGRLDLNDYDEPLREETDQGKCQEAERHDCVLVPCFLRETGILG